MSRQNVYADRTCSVTVHSYVSQNGDADDGTYAGEQIIPDDASPLSGAHYSLWKVGDVTMQTPDDTVTVCACHMNDEFMEFLIPGGLSPDNTSGEGEQYYRLTDIRDAWDKAAKDETALTELVKTRGSALPVSGIDGKTRADHLSEGLYVLAITQITDRDDFRVLSGHAPVLLMLPQLNASKISESEIEDPDDLWIYDVSVYPKSRTLESGKRILLSDMTLKQADDRETGSMISFISYLNLPNLGNSGRYDEAVLDDSMTDGLYHKKIAKVVYGAWLKDEVLSYDILNTYKELSPSTDYTVSDSEHGFRLSLTGEGLDKINALTFNSGLYVIYDALLGTNAAIGTDGPEANESSWAVSTDRTGESYTLHSPLVNTAAYGIDLFKTGLSDASDARFSINAAGSPVYFEKNGEGTYTAQGTMACENSVSSLSPSPDGRLRIRGLDSASYTITETRTEPGHSLLTSPFTVTLTGDPAAGSLVKAVLSVSSGDPIPLRISAPNGGIAEISVSNKSMITPLKAGDNGYPKIAACIFIFGVMLLAALIIRRRHLIKTDEGSFTDRLINNTDRTSAAEDQYEKKQDQDTERSV